MNVGRRKALGNVFFDVAKYLLTTTAVGSFLVKDVNIFASIIATLASFGLIAVAYYITSQGKEVQWKSSLVLLWQLLLSQAYSPFLSVIRRNLAIISNHLLSGAVPPSFSADS